MTMITTYHFKSTAEITTDVLEAIKTTFKGKSVILTVEEENADKIPDWHKKLVVERMEEIKENPKMILSEEAFQHLFSISFIGYQ